MNHAKTYFHAKANSHANTSHAKTKPNAEVSPTQRHQRNEKMVLAIREKPHSRKPQALVPLCTHMVCKDKFTCKDQNLCKETRKHGGHDPLQLTHATLILTHNTYASSRQ